MTTRLPALGRKNTAKRSTYQKESPAMMLQTVIFQPFRALADGSYLAKV